jgi:hypothetical protein
MPDRRDPPERRRHLATKDEDGRVSPAVIPLTATLLFLRRGRVVSALISSPPEAPRSPRSARARQKPSCHRHDGDPTRATLQRAARSRNHVASALPGW